MLEAFSPEAMENFYTTLTSMGTGMLGIFIVIGIIIGSMYLLGALSKKKSDDE